MMFILLAINLKYIVYTKVEEKKVLNLATTQYLVSEFDFLFLIQVIAFREFASFVSLNNLSTILNILGISIFKRKSFFFYFDFQMKKNLICFSRKGFENLKEMETKLENKIFEFCD